MRCAGCSVASDVRLVPPRRFLCGEKGGQGKPPVEMSGWTWLTPQSQACLKQNPPARICNEETSEYMWSTSSRKLGRSQRCAKTFRSASDRCRICDLKCRRVACMILKQVGGRREAFLKHTQQTANIIHLNSHLVATSPCSELLREDRARGFAGPFPPQLRIEDDHKSTPPLIARLI